MLNDILKRFAKVSLIGIAWVFVFSFRFDGRPLYFYAHDIFIDNALVRTVDEEATAMWIKIKRTARVSMDEVKDSEAGTL